MTNPCDAPSSFCARTTGDAHSGALGLSAADGQAAAAGAEAMAGTWWVRRTARLGQLMIDPSTAHSPFHQQQHGVDSGAGHKGADTGDSRCR